MARLTYQMWRLKDCEALRKQARLPPVMTPKEEKARAEAEARDRYRASYVFLEPHDRFPENKIMIEPNLCKTCVYADGHEVALLDEITGEHLKATPEELERAGIIVPQGTGEPTVDIASSPEMDSSVNEPVEDDFVPDYDPDDEPHPTQKTTSDIDQPPETVDEIIEIVGDHYKAALAEGFQDPQEDALESDDEEIVFNQQIVGGSSALESVADKMKFNKIYAAQYLEGGALHLSRNPHGAISMSSNALRHYTEAVTGRSIPLHFIDDDGDDDELPPPPPPAEPCPYKRDKDGVHRPVAEELPALKRKTAADLGAAPKAKAAPDSLKKLRTGDKVVNVDMSSSAEAGAQKGSSEVVDVEMEETDIHPKVLYHYTHIAFLDDVIRCGICPGGLRTSKAHSYFSAFDPWSIQKTSQAGMASTRPVAIAVDVEMAVAYGIRFAVTQSQAVVTTDWVPNQFLIYAYDVSAKCFIYANHDYAKERASFNQDVRDIVVRRRERLDRGDEADDNARRQSLLARSRWDLFGKYEKWVHGAWVENAFILERYNREFCKDQLEHADANIGTYSTPYMAIAWQPEGDAPNNSAWPLSLGSVDWAHWTPEMEMRYDPRGNEKFFTSRWITVRQHDVEPQHCMDCDSDSPFGCLSCLNCGRLARVATDMRKASLLVRLENLAASFGFDLSLDMFPDDDIRARGDRGLRNPAGGRVRTGQSAIATIRAHAKSHMDKASKLEFGSLTERLCLDPFYAFNCAAQDMSPDCLKFLQRLSSAVLPIPTRTAQQIQEGVGVNVKAKILMIPDTSQREVDVSNEVFVFWKNKILRPGVFVGLYAMEHHRFEATLMLLVIHWLLTPFMMTLGTQSPAVCCALASAQTLENPFGADANDLDVHDMQHDMNNRLLLLLDPISAIIPTLSGNQVQDHELLLEMERKREMPAFDTMWRNLAGEVEQGGDLKRTRRSSTQLRRGSFVAKKSESQISLNTYMGRVQDVISYRGFRRERSQEGTPRFVRRDSVKSTHTEGDLAIDVRSTHTEAMDSCKSMPLGPLKEEEEVKLRGEAVVEGRSDHSACSSHPSSTERGSESALPPNPPGTPRSLWKVPTDARVREDWESVSESEGSIGVPQPRRASHHEMLGGI
ncbi:UPF0187 protein [Durusdinium trenchii]|uniref:UPF0187 protein n=1 Tax=Durusdinium trenchii TaxID=1381693 RepID=A0ABP0K2N7_9DINO